MNIKGPSRGTELSFTTSVAHTMDRIQLESDLEMLRVFASREYVTGRMGIYSDLIILWFKTNARRRRHLMKYSILLHNEDFDSIVNAVAPLSYSEVTQSFLNDLKELGDRTPHSEKLIERAKRRLSF